MAALHQWRSCAHQRMTANTAIQKIADSGRAIMRPLKNPLTGMSLFTGGVRTANAAAQHPHADR